LLDEFLFDHGLRGLTFRDIESNPVVLSTQAATGMAQLERPLGAIASVGVVILGQPTPDTCCVQGTPESVPLLAAGTPDRVGAESVRAHAAATPEIASYESDFVAMGPNPPMENRRTLGR
jgi:hypothetical protein